MFLYTEYMCVLFGYLKIGNCSWFLQNAKHRCIRHDDRRYILSRDI